MGQGDEIRVAVVYTQWWLFISLNYPLWMTKKYFVGLFLEYRTVDNCFLELWGIIVNCFFGTVDS
jgi:hypothetical protein